MKLLITGSKGFIGKNMIKHFESLGVSPEKVLYILKELDN